MAPSRFPDGEQGWDNPGYSQMLPWGGSAPHLKVSPAPFQSSKKLYLVRTADAHGKAAPGDKDKSGEQVLNAKVNSSDKYISAEQNLSLFPILGCLWGRCSHCYMLLLKVVHAPLTCFRAWLARGKRNTSTMCLSGSEKALKENALQGMHRKCFP